MSDGTGPEKSGRNYQSIGMAVTLGFGVAISLAVLAGGGVWLDTKMDTAPLWSLVGLVLGLIAAGYQLYELALVSSKDKQNGPLAKKLEGRRNKQTR